MSPKDEGGDTRLSVACRGWVPAVLDTSDAVDVRAALDGVLEALAASPARTSMAVALTGDDTSSDTPNALSSESGVDTSDEPARHGDGAGGHADLASVLDQRGLDIVLGDDGSLSVAVLGTTVTAETLSQEEGAGITGLLELARDLQGAPIPMLTVSSRGRDWRPRGRQPAPVHADAPQDLRDPGRRADASDPTSILVHTDDTYLALVTTTRADLDELAPMVSAQVRQEIEETDPTLDADLADWLDPTSPRPKIRLLVPVQVTATGRLLRVVSRTSVRSSYSRRAAPTARPQMRSLPRSI